MERFTQRFWAMENSFKLLDSLSEDCVALSFDDCYVRM
nr:hypothetical protein [Candidatus Cyrtobacter comes]